MVRDDGHCHLAQPRSRGDVLPALSPTGRAPPAGCAAVAPAREAQRSRRLASSRPALGPGDACTVVDNAEGNADRKDGGYVGEEQRGLTPSPGLKLRISLHPVPGPDRPRVACRAGAPTAAPSAPESTHSGRRRKWSGPSCMELVEARPDAYGPARQGISRRLQPRSPRAPAGCLQHLGRQAVAHARQQLGRVIRSARKCLGDQADHANRRSASSSGGYVAARLYHRNTHAVAVGPRARNRTGTAREIPPHAARRAVPIKSKRARALVGLMKGDRRILALSHAEPGW